MFCCFNVVILFCVVGVFYICWFIVGVIMIFVVVVKYNVVNKLFVNFIVNFVSVLVVVGVISSMFVYLVNLMCFMVVFVVGLSKCWCIGLFDIVWSDKGLMNLVVEVVRIMCILVFSVVSLCIKFGVLYVVILLLILSKIFLLVMGIVKICF